MSLLPEGYEAPKKSGGLYTKFEEGETEILICDQAMYGYEYWTSDNKPVRSKSHPKSTPDIKLDMDGNPTRIKFFWAMPVWNVGEETFQIMQITQSTIQTELEWLDQTDKWPDPVMGFTISILRKGEGLDTEYKVTPNPVNERTEKIKAEAQAAYKKAVEEGFDIERLLTGDDPFHGEAKSGELKAEDIPF